MTKDILLQMPSANLTKIYEKSALPLSFKDAIYFS